MEFIIFSMGLGKKECPEKLCGVGSKREALKMFALIFFFFLHQTPLPIQVFVNGPSGGLI